MVTNWKEAFLFLLGMLCIISFKIGHELLFFLLLACGLPGKWIFWECTEFLDYTAMLWITHREEEKQKHSIPIGD